MRTEGNKATRQQSKEERRAGVPAFCAVAKRRSRLHVGVSTFFCFCVSAFAQSGGGYVITKSTIDSGGHSNLTDVGGAYILGGTVGQHDAAVLADVGGAYKLSGGFWSPAVGEPPPTINWDDNPLSANRTTRSLRFTVSPPVTATASPGQSAVKVTMIDLQNPVPPNLPQFPPPDFSGYESATCFPMTCIGGTRNGLTCTVDADCLDGVCQAAGETNGCARWVGKPGTFLEAQDIPLGAAYRAARLQCTPFYHDWTAEGLIAVVGAEIAPSSEYSVQTYGASCKGLEGGCTNVSVPVTMFTRRFGDVEVPFVPPNATGQPDVTDVAQLVNKFKNVTGAPVKAISQLQPNLPELNADINALDIVSVVDAVKQRAYSFSGPCPCPSTVTCGVTACSSPTICASTYGPGALCVKTCTSGDNAGDPCINDTHCPGSPPGACGGGFCRDRCGRCTP